MKSTRANALGMALRGFFADYLPKIRGSSPHTILSYRDSLKQAVIARASRVEKLLPAYRQAPSLLLEQEWRSARARMLDSPAVVKWYLSPGSGKTVVQINTPPEIEKELLRRRLQADKDRQQGSSGGR